MIRNFRLPLVLGGVLLGWASLWAAPVSLLDVMQQELDRSVTNLTKGGSAPMYFLQYSVTEKRTLAMAASNGALESSKEIRQRYLDVDVRVGGMELDNTHQIRTGNRRDNFSRRRIVDFPLDDNADAIRATLWNETEYQFQTAQERLTKVVTNRQVKVEEQDLSADFSVAAPQRYEEPFGPTVIDTARWQATLKRVGAALAEYPFVQESSVHLTLLDQNQALVNSEGSRIRQAQHYLRLSLSISGTASDGMVLDRNFSYDTRTPAGLPAEEAVLADAKRMASELQALMNAPIVEPYIGPAILKSRASGVFFHEIFGHRIEGHRQKSETEGQTFTKKVNEAILPDFISVYDDPTLPSLAGTDLRGYYKFDDEGTAAQRVTVVDHGVLKNFLTSRSPIDKFPASNGHGRREFGQEVVSRQANLIVKSDKTVPADQLRGLLIEACKKQGKPYGLIFDDISGGFTMTGRSGPQAFKVEPLLVHRVYADGRPDEVIRGVDIVGTPLTSFSKILTAADDDAVFNGSCGAESGWVPVSAISPSILVSEIEVEKRQKEQEKPPILPPPNNDPVK